MKQVLIISLDVLNRFAWAGLAYCLVYLIRMYFDFEKYSDNLLRITCSFIGCVLMITMVYLLNQFLSKENIENG